MDKDTFRNTEDKQFTDFSLHKKGKGKNGVYTIVANSLMKDRDNELILPEAFYNLKDYLSKNPVGLYGHNYESLPVFKAVDGRITENQIELDIVFAETEFAQEVKYLYDEGFLNSFSVGFIMKEFTVDRIEIDDILEERGLEYRHNPWIVITSAELLEVSAVPVPSNAASVMLRTASEGGNDLKELKRMILGEQVASSHQEQTSEKGETNRKASISFDKNKSKYEVRKHE